MTFAGWIATLAGWYTTEIGRQPWLVTGVLTTKEAVSDVAAGMVLGTLLTYLAVYVVLLAAYIATIFGLAGKASKGQALPPEPRLGSRPGLQPAE
jgi:cytochrome d ubiquinol oxidase subunit I